MKKLSMLVGAAALLTAAPFSVDWSQKSVRLSFDRADARIGRPLTPLSVAGVHRRAYRRAAIYGAAGYGLGSYYGYGNPAYSSYYSNSYAPQPYSSYYTPQPYSSYYSTQPYSSYYAPQSYNSYYSYSTQPYSSYYAPQSYYGYYQRPYVGFYRGWRFF
jgi:hypothetical protein